MFYNKWDKYKLWELRKQIILNSANISDYKNDFGIKPISCFKFFDGYYSFICDCIYDDFHDIPYDDFESLICEYDNPNNLEEWYYLCKMCYCDIDCGR